MWQNITWCYRSFELPLLQLGPRWAPGQGLFRGVDPQLEATGSASGERGSSVCRGSVPALRLRLTHWRKTRLPVRHQLCQSRPHRFLVFPRGTAMALHVGVWLSLLPWRSSPQQWAPALCPNYVKCILTVNFVGGHGAGGGRARFAPLLCVLLNNTQPILSPKCEMRILRGVPIYSRF